MIFQFFFFNKSAKMSNGCNITKSEKCKDIYIGVLNVLFFNVASY